MERHFLVPVSIAAALHAGLFFGVGRGPVPEHSTIRAIISRPPLPRDTIEVAPLPPPEHTDETSTATSAPADPIPHSPEPPPTPDRGEMHIELPPYDPRTSPGPISMIDRWLPGPSGNAPIGDVPHVLSESALDSPPNTRVQIAPDYPFEARKNGLSGEVIVEFLVDESGRVVSPRVVRSSDRVFEEPTLRAIAKWRFEPGKRDGVVVRFRMAIPIVFNVNDAL